MKERFMNLGLLWLRALMGLGMAYHGYGKIFGGRMEGFAQGVAQMGFPAHTFFAWAAALSEFAGGILIIIGFQTRYAAFFVSSTMAVAAFIRHASDPLKVKELAIAYFVMAVMIMITGAGRFSLDGIIAQQKK